MNFTSRSANIYRVVEAFPFFAKRTPPTLVVYLRIIYSGGGSVTCKIIIYTSSLRFIRNYEP
jgi:hypothetical protein